jgi:hypothetical protein
MTRAPAPRPHLERAGPRTRRSAGQATAEFALILPIFCLVFFAIIQFALATYAVQIANNAAREGARYAIVHGSSSLCPSGPMPTLEPNPCDPTGQRVVEAVRSYAFGLGTQAPDFLVTPTWEPDNGRGSTVTVQVTYLVRPSIGFVGLPPFTVTGVSSLVVNH